MYSCPTLKKPVAVVWMAEGNYFETMQISTITKESKDLHTNYFSNIYGEQFYTSADCSADDSAYAQNQSVI